MDKIFRRLSIVAVLLCTLIALYGLWNQSWPDVLPWSGRGALSRYLGYLTVVILFVNILTRLTSLAPLVAGGVVMVGLFTAAGALWPLFVTIWFFLAAWLVGRKILDVLQVDPAHSSLTSSVLVGVGIYGTVVSILAHFPVNYPGVYGVGLLLPVWLERKKVIQLVGRSAVIITTPANMEWSRYWSDVLLAALVAVYGMVALLPEVGWDPLVTHLFVPGQLADRQVWGFDVHLYALAVTPMLADWLFSIGYMLGGESAARLVNVGVVVILAILVREVAIWAGGSEKAGRLAALILVSTPLTFLEGSTLHVEGVLAAFLVGATLGIVKLTTTSSHNEQGRGQWVVVGLFLGCALSTKAITLLFLPALGGWLLWKWRFWATKESIGWAASGLVVLLLFGAIPYVDAWRITGNPVFPFFNEIFQSSLAPVANFKDLRWQSGLTPGMLYTMTFHSERYQEALTGAPGFQWLILLIPSVLFLIGNRARRGLALLLLAGVSIVLVFNLTATYFRYVYPAMVLLMAAMAVAIEKGFRCTRGVGRVVLSGALAVTLLTNTLFLNAASWYGDFSIRPILSTRERQAYMKERLPQRMAIAQVNDLNMDQAPVAIVSVPFIAGLQADALLASWYNIHFLEAVLKIGSDDDAFDLLQTQAVEYVILNKKWGKREDAGNPFGGWPDEYGMIDRGGSEVPDGQGPYESQRIHLENVTTEVAVFGDISVRRLNTERVKIDGKHE